MFKIGPIVVKKDEMFFYKNLGWEGTPFWCFIAFLLTSFAKISEDV
jgi:hypothetical protein